jgi:hypothetical protein
VTKKNAAFWDVTRATRLNISEDGILHLKSSACPFATSDLKSILYMETICSSETSVFTRATRCISQKETFMVVTTVKTFQKAAFLGPTCVDMSWTVS